MCQELSVTDIPSSKDADKNLARFWLMKRLMGVIKHCVQSFRRLVVEVFRFVLLFPIEDNSWFFEMTTFMVKAMFDRVSLPNKLEVVSSYHHHTDTYEQVCMYNSYNLLRHTYIILYM